MKKARCVPTIVSAALSLAFPLHSVFSYLGKKTFPPQRNNKSEVEKVQIPRTYTGRWLSPYHRDRVLDTIFFVRQFRGLAVWCHRYASYHEQYNTAIGRCFGRCLVGVSLLISNLSTFLKETAVMSPKGSWRSRYATFQEKLQKKKCTLATCSPADY